jgi:hypothetical protein
MDDIWELIDTPQIEESDIAYGCERAESFARLHHARNEEERQESINIMTSSLGLDQDKLLEIRKRLKTIVGERFPTALLGLLIGLWIAESVSLKEKDENSAVSG